MKKINLDADGDGKITKKDASFFGKGLKEVSKLLKNKDVVEIEKTTSKNSEKTKEILISKKENFNYHCLNCYSHICFTGGRDTAIECTVCHKKI